MERAWRGGLRIFVNLLVENGKLCELYPLKRNSCDEMDSIRLQAKDMRRAAATTSTRSTAAPARAGSGSCTDPFQARRVINAGQARRGHGHRGHRACSTAGRSNDVRDVRPNADDRPAARRGLPHGRRADGAGQQVRQRARPASPATTGTTGVVVNTGNKLETGKFWDMQHCHGPGRRVRPASRPTLSDHDARRRSSTRSLSSSCRPAARAGLPAPPALQHARPDRPRRLPDPRA